MAKPIVATPTIRGKAADRIRQEIQHGTKNTPDRVAFIRKSDEVYRQATERATRRDG